MTEGGFDTSRYVTPLGEVDAAAVGAFWARACRALPELDPAVPPPVEPFGDTVELAEELAGLVLAGVKRATATSWDELVAAGEPVPAVGRRWIVPDGSMRPRAVAETTEVRVGPLSSVDEAFARDEGEGDGSRQWWLVAHRWFFGRSLPELGLPFHDDIPVVFERFTIRYQEP